VIVVVEVSVGVTVAVDVRVAVKVGVGVSVAVADGVMVAVLVGVGVGVAKNDKEPDALQPDKNRIRINRIDIFRINQVYHLFYPSLSRFNHHPDRSILFAILFIGSSKHTFKGAGKRGQPNRPGDMRHPDGKPGLQPPSLGCNFPPLVYFSFFSFRECP